MRKASIGKAILLALALVLYGPSVLGQTRAAIYPIGNVSVTIPIPEGYIDVNDLVGDKRRVDALRTLLAATFASPSRPLGIFVSRDEISTFLSGSELKLVHVFSVSTNQNLEPQTLSTQEFQMAADIIRRQGKESVDTMEINRLATQVQLNAALESIRQKTRVQGVGLGWSSQYQWGCFKTTRDLSASRI